MRTDGMRLSVVMPVYNVGRFLPVCLDSLMAQTLQADEIVVVDDGSTDDCPRVLAEYAARMPNLRVIRQANGGLSAARNTGLAAARGRWLVFIDSDDFIAADMFAALVAVAEADNLDMALCNAWYHFEDRQAERPIYTNVADEGVLSGEEWLCRRLEQGRFMHMVWMHLYRRTYLKERALRFAPGLIHEDVVWTSEALLGAARVRFLPQPLYHSRISERRFDEEVRIRRLQATLDSSLHNARSLDAMASRYPAVSRTAQALRWQLVDGGFSVFHLLERLTRADLQAERRRQLRDEGYYRLLWCNAQGWRQKRKVLGRYLKHGILDR